MTSQSLLNPQITLNLHYSPLAVGRTQDQKQNVSFQASLCFNYKLDWNTKQQQQKKKTVVESE